jgi:hypothetical protein
VALFCFAVAVKWWVIGWVGSDLPWIDQWGPEAELYRRWLSDTLRWSDFFVPANEHRIVFTHLLNLGLLRLNGQWDPLLQMFVNALLNAAGIVFLAWWLGRGLAVVARWLVLLVAMIVMVAPFGVQNVVWGFQSQIYLCLLLSFAALWLTTESTLYGWRWWGGVALAVAAYFAMAPGAMVGVALLAWGIWRMIGFRRLAAGILPNAILGISILFLAWFLRTPVPRHAVLVAPDCLRFLQVLAGVLSWPVCDPRFFVLLNAPVLLLLFGRLTGRFAVSRCGETALLLMAWAVSVALTFAYYRGGAQDPFAAPPSRHADFFALLPVANALALAELWNVFGWRRAASLAGSLIWAAAFLWGAGSLLHDTQGYVQEHARLRIQMGFDVLALRETGERRDTLFFSVDGSIGSCTARLRDPLLQSVMPPLLQKEMPVVWPQDGQLLQRARFAPGAPIPEPFRIWATAPTDGGFGIGTVRSEPFFCSGPAVEVLAAFTARPGMAKLAFVSENAGERIVLACDSALRGEWVKLVARLPAGQYRLEIANIDPRGWVAVSAPRKLGRLGYWVRWFLAYRTLWLQLATGGSILALLSLWRMKDSGVSPAMT